MRILFITPPNYAFKINGRYNFNVNFPLGMAYMAAIAEQGGHNVQVIDCVAEGWSVHLKLGDDRVRIGVSPEELEARIREYSPDIVGISNLFSVQAEAAFEVANIVKKVSKEIITVIGGSQPTSQPKETLSCQNIDYVVMGEGELTFKEFLAYINNEKDPCNIPGLAYRISDGEIKINPRAEFITDLDLLPFPARHLFDMQLYFNHTSSHGIRKHARYASIVTSRGCPSKCTFCNVHDLSGRKYRYRSPENALKELKFLKETYNIQEVLFEDDNLTANRFRAGQLFQMMKEANLGLEWDTPNGVAVFALDNDLLDLMKSSGCYRVNLAIESADQGVIDKIIKKPVKLDKVLPLIRRAQKIGLEVESFFIVGLPGTTLDQMRRNFEFMRKHDMFNGNTSIFVPFPGTELYNLCLEKEYFIPGFDLRLATPARCCLNTPDWSSDDVEKLVERELFKNTLYRYFKHPLESMNTLKRIGFSPVHLAIFLKRLFRFIFLRVVFYKSS